jgi:hypothetical protein
MDGEHLDDGVCEQLSGQFGDSVRLDRLGEVYLEPLALAHARYLAEAQASARTGNRLALRVVDLRLQHHVDHESGHMRTVREPSLSGWVGIGAAWQ